MGIPETDNEGTYPKLISAVSQASITIKKDDISVCHRVPRRNVSRSIIAKFVRRVVKFSVLTATKKLRDAGSNVYINDDVTLLRPNIANALVEQSDISRVSMVNEKILINYNSQDTHVFAILFEIQKHIPQLVTAVCKRAPNFC